MQHTEGSCSHFEATLLPAAVQQIEADFVAFSPAVLALLFLFPVPAPATENTR